MIPHAMADLRQQGNRKLPDGSGAIGRDVRYGDAPLSGRRAIDDVVARGQDANHANTRGNVRIPPGG